MNQTLRLLLRALCATVFPLLVLRVALTRAWAVGVPIAWQEAKVSILNFIRCQRNKLAGEFSYCPICGWKGGVFYHQAAGATVLRNRICPGCGSFERQRFLHECMRRKDPSFLSLEGAFLHIAPRRQERPAFQGERQMRVISGDVSLKVLTETQGHCRLQMDVQRIPLRSQSISALFCIHVLEHVSDDALALSELHRVLQIGGIAYIMVPFAPGAEKTTEWGRPNPYWFDHYRDYSLSDFGAALKGFDWECIQRSDIFTRDEFTRFGIPDDQAIFRCVKREIPQH